MDQPISYNYVHHIYKHPLSILIHIKFQDKDGCSKNGSREFLFELEVRPGYPRSYNNTVWPKSYDLIPSWSIQFDHRCVPFYVHSRLAKKKDFHEFSSCVLSSGPNLLDKRTIDADAFFMLRDLVYIMRCVFNSSDDSIVKGREYIRSNVLSTIGIFVFYLILCVFGYFPILIIHHIMKIFYPTNSSIASNFHHINSSTILVPKLYDLSIEGAINWPELSVIHSLEDLRWLTKLTIIEHHFLFY